MSIVIIRQDDKTESWKKALLEVDPTIAVYGYDEDHPKEKITMAVVWKHPKGSLSEYPNLKCIASGGAGVDFIIADETAPTHIPITRVIDPVLAEDMSEHVLALILAYLKNLNEYRLNQTKGLWRPKQYRRIADLKVGILGLGELGSVLAKNLINVGFQVQGWSRSKKKINDVIAFAGEQELSSFLSSTEILVCLLPLTKLTEGILNAALFAQLPTGAFVINVARGGHLIDTDLLSALDSKHLSGAALDVFHQEPLGLEHPFWKHPKIHMTPHCASVSDTKSVIPQLLDNYERLSTGTPLLHTVSRTEGY